MPLCIAFDIVKTVHKSRKHHVPELKRLCVFVKHGSYGKVDYFTVISSHIMD